MDLMLHFIRKDKLDWLPYIFLFHIGKSMRLWYGSI